MFTYSAPVVKEKEFRLDGVFTPLLDDLSVPMVFVEAQMQADGNFYRRFFAETFLYLEQYEINRDWRGLLILPSRGIHLGTELPYHELLDHRITRIYLEEIKDQQGLSPNLALLQLLAADQEESAALSRGLLKTAETPAEYERRLSLIETILANKFPDLTEEMMMQILDLKKMDITRSRFYQQIREEVRAEALKEGLREGLREGRQEGLQEGLREGLREGRQEGHQEGRQEEGKNLVLRLLTRRFGELSESQVGQIRQLSLEQLEVLAEALLDFSEIADLDNFLKTMA